VWEEGGGDKKGTIKVHNLKSTSGGGGGGLRC